MEPLVFLPRTRDADHAWRRLASRDVHWALAYATSIPAHRSSRADHVWRHASANLVLGATIPLLGHLLFDWSIPWMLIALGVDLLGQWVADLVRQHAAGGKFDEAVSELVSRRHAVATARALLGPGRREPRLNGPDPERDNARFIRLSNWFAPFPALVVIALVAGWHYASTQEWQVVQYVMLLSPFLIRVLEAALATRRVLRGSEDVAALLPTAPAEIMRLLATATLYLWLARWTVDAFGMDVFERYGGIAALLFLVASAAAFAVLTRGRTQGDLALLQRFAGQGREALLARLER